MKKLFFILILIIATQLAFAHCYHTSTDNSGKNTVECAEFWWYSTDNTNKDTVKCAEIWPYSSNNSNKDTVECIGIWLTDNSNNKPVDAIRGIRYSTDISNNKPVDAIRGIRYSTGNNDTEDLYWPIYTTDKNAVIETQIKIFLLYTPGNKEKNESVFLKAKEVIKGKLHNLYNIP